MAVGLASAAWIAVRPHEVNTVLLVLWTFIAARGLYKALGTLKRTRSERMEARSGGDEELLLIANGNVRRNTFLAVKLAAFLIIGVSLLTGQNNTTVSRILIVLILLLMSGGAELDADEIDAFDKLWLRNRLQRRAEQSG